MRTFLAVVVLLLAAMADAGAATRDGMAAFLWGAQLLRESGSLDARQRSAYLRKLSELTGVTPADAIAFIRRHRDRPEAWQEFLGRLSEIAQDPAVIGGKRKKEPAADTSGRKEALEEKGTQNPREE